MIDGPVNSFLFRISLLLAMALVVDICLRRRFVLTLATFWNAILVSVLVVPLAILFVPRISLHVLPSQAMRSNELVHSPPVVTDTVSEQSIVSESAAAVVSNPNPTSTTSVTAIGIEGLVVVYLIGVVALLGRLVSAFQAVRALCLVATPVTDANWLVRFDHWRLQLGLVDGRSRKGASESQVVDENGSDRRSRVRLLESELIDGPFALGVLQPVIVIPSRLVPRMAREGVDAILTHELAHIARSDCAWQLLQRFVEAVLWFHPLVWLAQRRIDFIRERACDDFAVRMVGDFQLYGETLFEIAAGRTRKASYGIGMTTRHSSSLSRRLSAAAQGEGNSRYLASTRSRWLVAFGVTCAAIGIACLIFDSASAFEAPTTSSIEKDVESDTVLSVPKVPTPELIAVTWQQIRSSNSKRIEQPVWRPDGTLLSKEEMKSLQEEAEGFQAHWWNVEKELRPLVLMFRGNSGIQTGIMAGVTTEGGKRQWSGSWGHMRSTTLTKSAVSPRRSEFPHWPAAVEIEIKVPLENPVLIKTVDSISDERIDVGPGVRWYIDQQRGMDRSKPSESRLGLMAAVLEQRNHHIQSLTDHSVKVWLKGQTEPLREDYVTIVEPEPGVRAEIRVSSPIDDPRSVEKVEFFRQRFRMEQIKGIETHLDLLPPDDDSKGDSKE